MLQEQPATSHAAACVLGRQTLVYCIHASLFTFHSALAKLHFFLSLLQGDKSARVLELTADVIAANSAHYTAWQYRWQVLQELGTDLTTEYDFTQ